jgi:hypothetical protein
VAPRCIALDEFEGPSESPSALEIKDSFAKGKTILEMTPLARSGWVRFLWSLTGGGMDDLA